MNTYASLPSGSDPSSVPFDLSVDNVVFGFDGEQLQVLLIRQGLPGEDMGADRFHMAVPGDLVLPEEGLDEAAHRILSNLTSLQGIFGLISSIREKLGEPWANFFQNPWPN